MGDRAVVVFNDGEEVSPFVYLHWAADKVPEYIAKLADLHASTPFSGGPLSVDYAVARFVGIAHEDSPRTTQSLGINETSLEFKADLLANDVEAISKYSPGDGGVVSVDSRDLTWKAYDGYLANENHMKKNYEGNVVALWKHALDDVESDIESDSDPTVSI